MNTAPRNQKELNYLVRVKKLDLRHEISDPISFPMIPRLTSSIIAAGTKEQELEVMPRNATAVFLCHTCFPRKYLPILVQKSVLNRSQILTIFRSGTILRINYTKSQLDKTVTNG
jgi:hypothetical protein